MQYLMRVIRRIIGLSPPKAIGGEDISEPISERKLSLHTLEAAEEHRVEREETRRDAMSDGELRTDLEEQYGKNRWATKLIDDLVTSRTEGESNRDERENRRKNRIFYSMRKTLMGSR